MTIRSRNPRTRHRRVEPGRGRPHPAADGRVYHVPAMPDRTRQLSLDHGARVVGDAIVHDRAHSCGDQRQTTRTPPSQARLSFAGSPEGRTRFDWRRRAGFSRPLREPGRYRRGRTNSGRTRSMPGSFVARMPGRSDRDGDTSPSSCRPASSSPHSDRMTASMASVLTAGLGPLRRSGSPSRGCGSGVNRHPCRRTLRGQARRRRRSLAIAARSRIGIPRHPGHVLTAELLQRLVQAEQEPLPR